MKTAFLAFLLAGQAAAQDVADMASREGWAVLPSEAAFDDLVEAVRSSAGGAGLNVVTQAGPTGAAARRGIEIPGNRVIGLFNNDFAVRLLRLSTPAMIEAPMRIYVTEDADGTATLAYKLPSRVLEPYAEDSADPDALRAIGVELDAAFSALGRAAVR
ncbi:DUF302 domain-containing protein [Jannaschia aquimarina]|uniref:DUF302 domain-containing protein n=1 Tax=Jannaschia aquimarina TaxID=935700 RepID=A0A0D1CM10_9RHOB|nr:DUF302 domain-containing protein [Jannaschia aquimarina]KIT15792.1 hypothetical protein jaqu_24710 [Jannaschia aquimarina]SNT42946.1 Uncharacterized conserved protein, DUF302 family [Jannaschia aquimarina]